MSLDQKKANKTISVPFVCAVGTDIGLRRDHNEDTYIFDVKHKIFAVIDGMGGYEKGEVAAKIAAEKVQTSIRGIEQNAFIKIHDSIILANNEIYELAKQESTEMGCVLTVLLIENDLATIGHVGDTRLYKITDGKLKKLTTDHSIVGELEAEGGLSEQKLLQHPRRNEVTRSIGIEERSLQDENFVEILQTNFQKNEAFLICSDGLSDLLTSSQILEIIEDNADYPNLIIENLISKANELGGKDNITAIFVGGVDFARRVIETKNNLKFSKFKKIRNLFFNRWAFFLYGLIVGVIACFILLQNYFGSVLDVSPP
jgi:serine/threonine protein phosphatase PrpC